MENLEAVEAAPLIDGRSADGATRYIRKPSDLEEFLGLGVIFKALLKGSPE